MCGKMSAKSVLYRIITFGLVMLIGTVTTANATPSDGPRKIKQICGSFGACSELGYSFSAVGEKVFFLGHDEDHGFELWISDGSEAGTHLVKDIVPGPTGFYMCMFCALERIPYKDKLLFQVHTWEGPYSLWVSDGTEEGTQHVKDLDQFSLFDFNGFPIVITSNGDSHQIYTTDATTEGTVLVKTIVLSGVHKINTFVDDSYLYILFIVPSSGVNEPYLGILWRTDGTTGETIQLAEIPNIRPYEISNWVSLNGSVYFISNYSPISDPMTRISRLWGSDGTPGGTQVVATFPYQGGAPIRDLIVTGNLFFFAANKQAEAPTLWQSDGTSTGTVPVEDSGGPFNPATMTSYKGKLFFSSNDPVTAYYMTIGRSGGIDYFTDQELNNTSYWQAPVVVGNVLFYVNGDGSGNDVWWKTDGAHIVKLVDVGAQYTEPRFYLANGRDVFFSAYTAETGYEFWGSWGIPAGTRLLADLTPGPGSIGLRDFTLVGNRVFFTMFDSNWDLNLWMIDPISTQVHLPLVRR